MCIIKKDLIEKLEKLIEEINNTEDKNKLYEFLNKNVEDVEFFLITLKKINKKNIQKFTSNKKNLKKSNNNSNNVEIAYTRDEVIKIFESHNRDITQIVKKYKKKQLDCMYYVICGIKPSSTINTKEKIANSLKRNLSNIERANHLLNKI